MHFQSSLAFSRGRQSLVAVAAVFGMSGAGADPLNPLAYGSLGSLNLAAGSYTLNTSGALPQLLGPGATVLYTGVLQAQADAFNPLIAVFDFDSINIAMGATITASGSNPVALLSRSGIGFAGTLDAAGRNGGDQGAGVGGLGGPGAGRGGTGGAGEGEFGLGPGGGAGGYPGLGNGSWGEGGAFGGNGSNWNPARSAALAYGDLGVTLQAGSGGGASGRNLFGNGAGGGGGGGGVEFGAVNFITLGAGSKLNASGGQGGNGTAINTGGGSGGGVLLHAPLIDLQSSPELGPAIVDASGFSGGRVAFFTGNALVQGNLAGVSVGANFYGQVGVITFSALAAVPEPASGALLLLGVTALVLGRRKA